MRASWMALTLLASCTWITDQEFEQAQDFDGDGFISIAYGGDDCVDEDARVHPDAEERCDTRDWNCDGRDGLQDEDDDGFAACEDCEDGDAAVNPAADEVCDAGGIDEDCDGYVNDEDTSVLGQTEVWTDADGDGFGDVHATSEQVCEPRESQVENDEDCDDTRSQIPAIREVCGDGFDNDCDGTTDLCMPLEADYPDHLYIHDQGIAALGYTVALERDFTGDGLADLVASAPFLSPQGPHLYLLAGPLPASALADLTNPIVTPDYMWQEMGRRMATSADLTGDGVPDLIVSGPEIDVGATWVIPGPLTTPSAIGDSHTWMGSELGSKAGRGIAAADINADGQDDLLIGAPLTSGGNGATHIIYGPITGDGTVADDDLTLYSSYAGDEIGQVVASLGDTNGDGIGDAAIGAPKSANDNGAVHILRADELSTAVGGVELWASVPHLVGGAINGLGTSVAGEVDIDGDGYDDMLVLALDPSAGPGWSSAAYVCDLSPGNDIDGQLNDNRPSVVQVSGTALLRQVTGVGDVDGDGFGDLLLAGELGDGTARAWLIYGPVAPQVDPTALNSALSTGFGAEIHMGDDTSIDSLSISGGGDANGDGLSDFAIGRPRSSPRPSVAIFDGWPRAE